MSDWSRFSDQFRETNRERQERLRGGYKRRLAVDPGVPVQATHEALTYAQRLATYAASLYGPPEGWRPMNDLMSVLDQINNALSGLETPGGRWLPFSENAKVAREFIAYRPDAGTFAAVWIYPPHEDGDGSLDLEAEPTLFTAAGEDISDDPPTFWQPMPTYMED